MSILKTRVYRWPERKRVPRIWKLFSPAGPTNETTAEDLTVGEHDTAECSINEKPIDVPENSTEQEVGPVGEKSDDAKINEDSTSGIYCSTFFYLLFNLIFTSGKYGQI